MRFIEGIHVMVDLETLGIRTTSVLLSIGAAKFNKDEIIDKFYININISSCLKEGMTYDQTTIEWWKKQSEEAKASLRSELYELKAALIKFSEWFGPKPLPLWGNGVGFDNVILGSAFDRVGLPRPWRYLDDRCFRTIKALFPPKEDVPFEGTPHNSLDDAIHEAKILIKINQQLI